MNRNLTQAEIETIAALGYQVFMTDNPHFQTYCFYSDGERIGYLQREDLTGALSIATIHYPNRQTGTGFKLDDIGSITRSELDRAFVDAPNWASSADRASVKKYANLETFLKDSRGKGLRLVAGGAQ